MTSRGPSDRVESPTHSYRVHQPVNTSTKRKGNVVKHVVPDPEALDLEHAIRVAASRAAVFHTLDSFTKARILDSIVDVLSNAFVRDLSSYLRRLQRACVAQRPKRDDNCCRGLLEIGGEEERREKRERREEERDGWQREKRHAKRAHVETSCRTASNPTLGKAMVWGKGARCDMMIDTSVNCLALDNEIEKRIESYGYEPNGKLMGDSDKGNEEMGDGANKRVTAVHLGQPSLGSEDFKRSLDVSPGLVAESSNDVDCRPLRAEKMFSKGTYAGRVYNARQIRHFVKGMMNVSSDDQVIIDGPIGDDTIAFDEENNDANGPHARTEASSADDANRAKAKKKNNKSKASSSNGTSVFTSKRVQADTAPTIVATSSIQSRFTSEIPVAQKAYSIPVLSSPERTPPEVEASPVNTTVKIGEKSIGGVKRQVVRFKEDATGSESIAQHQDDDADLIGPLSKLKGSSPRISETKAEVGMKKETQDDVRVESIRLNSSEEPTQNTSRFVEVNFAKVRQQREQRDRIKSGKTRTEKLRREHKHTMIVPKKKREMEIVKNELERQEDDWETGEGKRRRQDEERVVMPRRVKSQKEQGNTNNVGGRGGRIRGGEYRIGELGKQEHRSRERESSGKNTFAARRQRKEVELTKAQAKARKQVEQRQEGDKCAMDLADVHEKRQKFMEFPPGRVLGAINVDVSDSTDDVVLEEGLGDLNFTSNTLNVSGRSHCQRPSEQTKLPWWRKADLGEARSIRNLSVEDIFRGFILAVIRSSVYRSWTAEHLREQHLLNPSSVKGKAFLAISTGLHLMERARHMGQCRVKWKRQLIVELLARRDIEWSIVQGNPSFPHFVGCEACQKFRQATRRIRLAGPRYDSRNFWPNHNRISVLSAKRRGNCIEVSAELNPEGRRFIREHNTANREECELYVDAECLRKCLVFHEIVHSTAILAEDIRFLIEEELSDGVIKVTGEDGGDDCVSDCLEKYLVDILSQNTEFLSRRTAHFIDLVKLGDIYFSAIDAEVLDSGAGSKPEAMLKASKVYDAPIELDDDKYVDRVHMIESVTKKKSLVTSFGTLH